MNMKEMMGYEAPQVEIVEVEVEKGFAVSGDGNYDPMNPSAGA